MAAMAALGSFNAVAQLPPGQLGAMGIGEDIGVGCAPHKGPVH
jgi:hypothetical protein